MQGSASTAVDAARSVALAAASALSACALSHWFHTRTDRNEPQVAHQQYAATVAPTHCQPNTAEESQVCIDTGLQARVAAAKERARVAKQRSKIALARAARLQAEVWEVVFSKVAVRDQPCTRGKRVAIKARGDRVRGALVDGAECDAEGNPLWLQLAEGGFMLTHCSGQSGASSGAGYGLLLKRIGSPA